MPRIAVVTSEIGIPSEVWMVRQMQAFTRVTPVLFGWTRARNPVALPPDIEQQLFTRADTRTPSLIQRLARRAGHAAGYLPGAADRRELRDRLLASGAEAVLCHFAWNAIPVAMALDGALPLIVQVHGRDVSSLLERPAYRRALSQVMGRFDHLAAVGSFQLARLQPLGLPAGHSVIPCGAPTGLFGTAPLPLRQPGAAIRFVSLGRITAEKGMLQTLAAFEQVHAAHPRSELILIGGGPDEAELDRAIAQSPAAGAVQRTGMLDAPAVARHLASCHVMVQHSREVGGWVEGFGVMLTEGGAAGLALVASRSGGIPDQVRHGVNGLLFEPDDVPAQAAAMLRLATDEPCRAAMGAEARRIAATFDSVELAARLEQRILDAIAARKPGA